MLRALWIAAFLAAWAPLALAADASLVQVGNAVVDNNSSDPHADLLALATLDGTDKAAVIVARIYSVDNEAGDQLIVTFYDKGDWDKFVALWNDAVHAKTQTEAEAYNLHRNIPSYFDPATKTLVSAEKDTDGNVVFTLGGNPDAHNDPTVLGMIRLVPSRFDNFDTNVKAVSAFFAAK